ncbi:arginyltransferase [Enterovibrio makurazakiensis]|uniref:arginyltransferase n=1 Tax=Enterovibrio makurazakiensis TaxID=2910232 RepID=UPI003D221235
MRRATRSFRIGVMPPSSCSYLPDRQESVAIVLDAELHNMPSYDALIQSGFRRSGDNIYRPHCAECTACHSLRVDTAAFTPSKSQKRQINQLNRLEIRIEDTLNEDWFSLYERYINQRHQNGSMYPANKQDFLSFIQSGWQRSKYIHLFDGNTLIAIAVTDVLVQGYSAIYSFFDPDHPWSLGSLCVLAQIQTAAQHGIPWLYLGFQIDDCAAMRYKQKFTPNERFTAGEWKTSE